MTDANAFFTHDLVDLEAYSGPGGKLDITATIAESLTSTQTYGAFFALGDETVPCFALGTRIRTDAGEMPVEQLRPGMSVATSDGRLASITWIGERRIALRRHPRPFDVQPVRVAANAFAPGQPRRAVCLSPDHAVFIDGVLIPIRYLINGTTVRQLRAASVYYFHVELDRHAVLFAEGMPAESYLDTGNRAAFANAGATTMLHADFARGIWAAHACAELVLAGAALAAARNHLLERAQGLGHRLTGDPALRVVADGKTLQPQIDGTAWRVRLPAGARGVRLVSDSWVPAHTRADEDDTRRLGVAIRRVRLDGAEIALDDPRLSSGWHTPERTFRWSDGDAGFALAGVRDLAFELAMTGTYWQTERRRRLGA